MQEQHLFEYAVIRVVPRMEREEFLNVGVVLYCAKEKFLQTQFHLNKERLSAFCAEIDIPEIEKYLHSFEQICAGGKAAGPIGLLPIHERFRWLTATRSTVIQTSKVHPGFCTNANAMLQQLYAQLVL